MKKTIYKFEYRDCIGRKCVREYKAKCIVSVMEEAKKFVQVNRVQLAKIITPNGKTYYL